MEPQLRLFSSPREPSLLGIIFGTKKRLMPFMPLGASGVLAKTR